MVIVEGPDNSGKTTLARKLAEDIGMPYQHSKGPWKTRRELLNSVGNIHTTNDSNDYFIQDRYGLISELMYQPILRPDKPIIDQSQVPEKALWSRVTDMEFLIICLPPLYVVRDSKTLWDEPQPVREHIEEIYKNYVTFTNLIERQDIRLFIYDWTNPWHYRMLKLAIQGYYDNDVAFRGMEQGD